MTNVGEELQRLMQLRADGVLSDAEFETQKAKLLASNAAPATAPKRGMGRNIAIGCGGIVAILIVLGVIGAIAGGDKTGSDGKTGAASTQGAAPQAMAVTPAEVAKAYQSNEARAQATYGGKPLLVTGKVEGISLDILNKPFIQLDTGGFIPANANLDEASQAKAPELNKGDAISLRCSDVQEVISIPQFQDCAIQ